jgi:hypothetical protein
MLVSKHSGDTNLKSQLLRGLEEISFIPPRVRVLSVYSALHEPLSPKLVKHQVIQHLMMYVYAV